MPDKRTDFIRHDLLRNLTEEVNEKTFVDFEHYFGISYEMNHFSKSKIIFSIDHLSYFNDIKNPIHRLHFDDSVEILLFYRKYINLNLDFSFSYYRELKNNLWIGLDNHLLFTYYKLVQINDNENLDKLLFEKNRSELYMTFLYQIERLQFKIGYRALNINFIDEARYNNGKLIDFYNLPKVRLGIGYVIN